MGQNAVKNHELAPPLFREIFRPKRFREILLVVEQLFEQNFYTLSLFEKFDGKIIKNRELTPRETRLSRRLDKDLYILKYTMKK